MGNNSSCGTYLITKIYKNGVYLKSQNYQRTAESYLPMLTLENGSNYTIELYVIANQRLSTYSEYGKYKLVKVGAELVISFYHSNTEWGANRVVYEIDGIETGTDILNPVIVDKEVPYDDY